MNISLSYVITAALALSEALSRAHSRACDEDQDLLAMILRDLIPQAVAIERRASEIRTHVERQASRR